MKLVIEIPEEVKHKVYAYGLSLCPNDKEQLINAIRNGTPLDTHDEEIIATTVESIWGKPPYTELLDKIRVEIEDVAFDWQEIDGEHESFMVVDLNDALRIIDKYKAESEE